MVRAPLAFTRERCPAYVTAIGRTISLPCYLVAFCAKRLIQLVSRSLSRVMAISAKTMPVGNSVMSLRLPN